MHGDSFHGRDLARHRADCHRLPHDGVLKTFEHSYSTLDRVLVVDCHRNKLGVNGVGNMFGDYVLWFAAAAASRRALFIDWTAGVDAQPGRGSRPHRRFDLGVHFSGKGAADWAWSQENRQRVRARWLRNRNITLSLAARPGGDGEVRCGAIWQTILSVEPVVRLTLGENSAIALTPKCSSGSSDGEASDGSKGSNKGSKGGRKGSGARGAGR